MTENTSNVQVQNTDKEYNFRKLEERYERKLAEERAAREEAERKAKEVLEAVPEEEDSEPYVDHKKLKKEQVRFGQQIRQQTQSDIQSAVQTALAEERRQNWLKNNPDFFDVMKHANTLAQKDPELAESILEMPETFERQKLVYKNIKALGLHQPAPKEPSIQEKVDANKKSPYYQPSGFASSPYGNSGDFSQAGQKNAYQKMQELKNRLRI